MHMSGTILVVEADASGQSIAEALRNRFGYQVAVAPGADEAMQYFRKEDMLEPDLIFLDAATLGEHYEDVVQGFKSFRPDTSIIVMFPYGTEVGAAKAISAGAHDFLCKPVPLERFDHSIKIAFKMQRQAKYISWLERKAAGHMDFTDIVGRAPGFTDVLAVAQLAANSKIPVWIEGEEGTGKEMFARAIHGASDRAGKAFVVVNCETLSEHKAQEVLFGHSKGALAGKANSSLGKLREADQGTLSLHEVGALPPSVQQQLLQVLETGYVTPLGSSQSIKVDLRVICTSISGQHALNNKERPNQKLYQRLKSVVIPLPSLRNRKEDIILLAEHFLTQYCAAENKFLRGFTPEAILWLKEHNWPGNVHELSNILWRSVMLCSDEWVDVSHIKSGQKAKYQDGLEGNAANAALKALVDEQGKMRSLKSVQEEAIRFALDYSGGCMTRAAKSLGIGRSTLYRKIKEFEQKSYISRANQTILPMMKVSERDRS